MAGRKVWAADEILAAADLQSYIQDQVVFVYANASARSSGILSPTEGMVSYLQDTNLLYTFDASSWVEVAPNVGTAGTYTKVTTDAKGRVTSGTTLSSGDIPNLDTSKITSGTMSADRLPTTAIAKGGTGATTAGNALTNLGAASNRTTSNNVGIGWTQGGGFRGYVDATDFGRFAFLDGSGNLTDPVSTGGNVSAAGFSTGGNITAVGTYNQTNTGRAMYVASNGLYGIGASSERFKKNIVDAELDIESVKKIAVRNFEYKKDFGGDGSTQIGVIAEELVALGLTDFVYFDDAGLVDGVAYEKLALALIPVIQNQEARLIALESKVK